MSEPYPENQTYTEELAGGGGDTSSNGGFDWGGLFNKAVDVGAKVVSSKVDKPASAAQANNTLTPGGSEEALYAAKVTPAAQMSAISPTLVYVGIGAVVVVLFGALLLSRK